MRFGSVTSFFGLGGLTADRRRALGIVYATSVAVVMGVNFLQPALPAITAPFGISDAALGLVMAVFTAPAIFLAPLFGMLADLWGRRLLLAGGLLVYGLSGAAMALAPSFSWLLFFRAVQGVGYSAVIPLTIVLIGDLLEGEKEIGGQGLKVFLDRVGYLILPPLGGALAAIAWYWPFAMYLLAVPLGAAALAWMPETRGENTNGARAYLGDVARLARHPRLLIAFAAGFLRFFLDYGFLTYFPLFLVRTHGFSTATAGLLYTVFSLGAMATSSQAGRLAAGRDKAFLLLVAFVVSGLAVTSVPFLPGVPLVGGALFFYGLANGVISPMQKSLLTQNAPVELRGGVVSLDRLIQQISKTTATSAVGLLLITAELPTIFWMLGLLSLAAVGLMAALVPRAGRPVPSHAVP
ncbi:MAG TPA: MFS transporter [candidate division Zixibacteria bacterium]|nr:MFS transporter [candidate division Zixibacteria bacterium]